MTVRGFLSTAEVARRLGIDEDVAIRLVRRVGPRDTVRLGDGRLLVPPAAVEVLRRALP